VFIASRLLNDHWSATGMMPVSANASCQIPVRHGGNQNFPAFAGKDKLSGGGKSSVDGLPFKIVTGARRDQIRRQPRGAAVPDRLSSMRTNPRYRHSHNWRSIEEPEVASIVAGSKNA